MGKPKVSTVVREATVATVPVGCRLRGSTGMGEGTSFCIADVGVFDSVEGRVSGPFDVTVGDGTINSVSPAGSNDAGISRIDGTGKTLIPGLIDAHWHTAFTTIPAAVASLGEAGYVFAQAVASARDTLMRGFTTVRDLGGPSFGIKLAIDQGSIPGPRIYPSGAFISQTGGHGDFRMPNEIPRGIAGHLSHSEILGAAVIADGEDEVLRGARELLLRGASQLKLMAGGGIASSYDPLDVSQYTEREIRAAVDAAENCGTYVTVHAYAARRAHRDRRWSAVHRARPATRQGHRGADGREGHLVVLAALPRRRGRPSAGRTEPR
jgi:imidazolonepropionase-like amidohydrolase